MMKNFWVSLVLSLLFFTANSFADEKLIFAADLIRHGDRTPEYEIPKSLYAWKEGLGKLTALGMQQEYQLGKMHRQEYIDQYHLLPHQYAQGSIYVRSTDMDRTLMSAQYFMLGLYSPKLDSMENITLIPVHTVSLDQDTLLLAKPSRNGFSFLSMYVAMQRAWKKRVHEFAGDFEHWRDVTGMKINDFQDLNHLADNLYIRRLHHVSLPKGMTDADIKNITSITKQFYISAFKHNDVTYPMGHKFLLTVAKYMRNATQENNKVKYVLFAAHDTSIMAVMNTLGNPLDTWPKYASDLNFTLWKINNEYFVKVKLNNKPVIIPGCNREICSLAQFEQIA